MTYEPSDMLSKIKAMSGTSVFKLLAVLAILSLAVGYKMYSDSQKYNLGYNTAKTEMLEANERVLRQAQTEYETDLADAKGRLEETLRDSQKQRELASSLQEQLRTRPVKERIVEITKFTSPDCSSLGDEYNRLSKSIIGVAPVIPIK